MKVTKEELKELQGRVSSINQAKLRLGTLQVQKQVLTTAVVELQRQLEEFHKKLDVLYGEGEKISVDVNTGDYVKLQENETDKKN